MHGPVTYVKEGLLWHVTLPLQAQMMLTFTF